MQFMEIETKYNAEDIKLMDFVRLMESMNPTRVLAAASWDHYYAKSDDEFLRHRDGVRPELTVKRKHSANNSWRRTEVNLKLEHDTNQLKTVEAFTSLLGYKPSFSIYKVCTIYYWAGYNIVYYTVFDENFKELGRFIEIEMAEDGSWTDEDAAWVELLRVEKELQPLGITASRRTRRSLFEMYNKAA